MTPEDICGNCGDPIPPGSNSCPKCSPKKKSAEVIPAFLVIAVLVSSFLMLGSSVVNVATLPETKPVVATEAAPVKDLKAAAFEAAKGFIDEKFPGPKRFSELYQSTIIQDGNKFVVSISADEISQGTPVRSFFSVELEYANGAWFLNGVKR